MNNKYFPKIGCVEKFHFKAVYLEWHHKQLDYNDIYQINEVFTGR